MTGRAGSSRWRSMCTSTSCSAPELQPCCSRIFPMQWYFRSATGPANCRSEEHTSELQSLMRLSYAVFCLKKKNIHYKHSRKSTDTQSLTSSTHTTDNYTERQTSKMTHIDYR